MGHAWHDSDFMVYMLTFPNGKKYIGITNNTERRWSNNGKGYKQNQKMYDAIQLYGWNNVKKEILLRGLNYREAIGQETKLIHSNNTIADGYNRTYSYRFDSSATLDQSIHLEKYYGDELKSKDKQISELESKLKLMSEQITNVLTVMSNTMTSITSIISFIKEEVA